MNIETVKQEYMTMYDSLVAKIDNELQKLIESTFFVDSISFNIVDNVIKMDVNSLLERSKIIISSDNVSDDERKELEEKDKRIKEKIVSLKSLMIKNYNSSLYYVRQKKDTLLSNVSDFGDLVSRVESINIPDDVNSERINYRTNVSKRIGIVLDIETMLNNISEIQREYNDRIHKLEEEKRLEENRKNDIRLKIISDIEMIGNNIDDFENGVKVSLLMDEIRREYLNLSNYIRATMKKMNDERSIFSDNEYNNYFNMLVNLDDRLFKTRHSIPINEEDVHDKKIAEYKTLKYNLYMLDEEILNYIDTVMGMFDNKDADLDMFIDDYMNIGKQLNSFEFIIEEKLREKIIDKQLYDNLINYISRCRGHFDELGNKIKKIDDEKIEKIVTQENKKTMIDQGKVITALEDMINNFEKLINNDFWDDWKRKRIDELFEFYEKKVQKIYDEIDVTDEKRINENTELIGRLDVIKAKLSQLHGHKNILEYQNKKIDNLKVSNVSKNDFSKFKVKVVKSTKDFYQKHKDKPLTILGLAKMSFKHPTIIPALVHGMIVEKLPIRDKLIEMFPDKFIEDEDKIYMANGMEVNSKIAVSSMLKAIADSDVSNPKIVTNMVQGVKSVIGKAEKTAKKVSENVKKFNKNFRSMFNDNDIFSRDDEYGNYIRRMASQYLLTKMTVDEFCNKHDISSEDKYNLSDFLDKKYYWDLANDYALRQESNYEDFVNEKGLNSEQSSKLIDVLDQIYYNNLASEYKNSGMDFDEFCKMKTKGSSRFSKEQFADLLDTKGKARGAK